MKVDVKSVFNPEAEPYTARASVSEGGGVDVSTSKVTGDRSGGLFKAGNALGKNEFLQLLVKQLQFQDPLNPMENTEFVSQLAQFSALEGTDNIRTAIGEMNDSFKETLAVQNFSAQSVTNASAVSLIGKVVRLRETKVVWTGLADKPSGVRVHLGARDRAVVNIVDDEGTVVRSLETGKKDAGNSAMAMWDGRDNGGEPANPGTYSVVIEGQEADDSLYAFVEDLIQGIRFTGEGPLVKIDGKELPIGNIMDVSIGEKG